LNTLIFLDRAAQEFQEAAQWYEERSPGLGSRFIEAVQYRLEVVRDYPEGNPKRKMNFREAVVKIFPFTIVYVFYKRKKLVTVISIFHTSRNPALKFKRTKR